jgi:hypothetical protein
VIVRRGLRSSSQSSPVIAERSSFGAWAGGAVPVGRGVWLAEVVRRAGSFSRAAAGRVGPGEAFEPGGVPGPAGGQAQCDASAVASESSGHDEQAAAPLTTGPLRGRGSQSCGVCLFSGLRLDQVIRRRPCLADRWRHLVVGQLKHVVSTD